MGGQRAIIHGSIYFPHAEFSGRLGLEAARRIRKAVERARGRMPNFSDSNAPIKGSLDRGGAALGSGAGLTQQVLLGAGMLYTKTTTASLVWMVLNSIVLLGDQHGRITNGEPGYFSMVLRNSGANGMYTLGKNSLRAALNSPVGMVSHHRMLKNLARGMGAEVGMMEIVAGLPCREVLAVKDEEGGYAIRGRVPIGELVILNDPEVVARVCRLEAQAEALRIGEEADVLQLEKEMIGMLRRLRDLGRRREE